MDLWNSLGESIGLNGPRRALGGGGRGGEVRLGLFLCETEEVEGRGELDLCRIREIVLVLLFGGFERVVLADGQVLTGCKVGFKVVRSESVGFDETGSGEVVQVNSNSLSNSHCLFPPVQLRPANFNYRFLLRSLSYKLI